MDIKGGVNIRAFWYDRSNTSESIVYNGTTIGNHAWTSRGDHTVSILKKALIKSIIISMYVNVVSTLQQYAECLIKITPEGEGVISYLQLRYKTNVLNERIDITISPDYLLNAGDMVELYTANNAVDGSVGYNITVSLNEFNA